MADVSKTCRKCGETKPGSHFNQMSSSTDGLAPVCRACVNAGRRARTQTGKKTTSSDVKLKAAARKGALDEVRALLPQASRTDATRLIAVAIHAHGPRKQEKLLTMCESLLATGDADPHGYCEYGSLLGYAATRAVPHYVALLQKYMSQTSIHDVAAVGDSDSLRDLLGRNTDRARSSDGRGRTPLHYAAGSRQWVERGTDELLAVATQLLEAGADVNVRCNPYLPSTPFEFGAVIGGCVELVELMLSRSAVMSEGILFDVLRSLRTQDDEFARIAGLLVLNGLDVNDSRAGLPYLYGQARHEDIEATTWLLDHGADVNVRMPDGRTPLHAAADRNTGTGVVALLIDAGADPNATDDLGNTPLDYARLSGKRRIVQFLEKRR